ncbi:MAG: glycosyltransferase [Deltaproteobacteria bacterium]|nr:glycosyltransferase [Deltaproteobacteria bacterium]
MLRSLIEDLLRQTRRPDEIIIIDNASSDNTGPMIEEYEHISYFRLQENLGSAGGYYEGLKIACERNNFVWTLDDDMIVKEDALALLERWWRILEKDYRLGALRSWVGQASKTAEPIKINSFAWRGTFLKREVILNVGLPLKDYFLYADDDEYAHRIKKKGYAMFFIPPSNIKERRIEDKIRFNSGVKKIVLYKEKFRFYYAFRNQIDMYLRYKEFYRLFKTFCYAAKVIFLFILIKRFESTGIIRSVFDGIWDGWRSNLGKNQKYLPTI